jgi:CDP-diacylglycerol--glycerol-3-phosphate 3-phosphatidyltransferase
MNLPNKLTVARMLMIPLFLLFFFWKAVPFHYFWALVMFGLASLTDLLDGRIARSRGLVTDFGKLMDPLADKLLVMSAMICLITADMVSALLVILILAREFLVTAIRQVAAASGKVLAADNWGKLKTVCQMIWICVALLYLQLTAPGFSILRVLVVPVWWVALVLLSLAVLFTVASGVNYFWKNRKLFAER